MQRRRQLAQCIAPDVRQNLIDTPTLWFRATTLASITSTPVRIARRYFGIQCAARAVAIAVPAN
jgi:hypothetical protein